MLEIFAMMFMGAAINRLTNYAFSEEDSKKATPKKQEESLRPRWNNTFPPTGYLAYKKREEERQNHYQG